MNSIFKVTKLRRYKLKEMISLLFPEFKYIFVKNNGIVKFKRHWFSLFTCKSIHVSELCITEIPNRLSEFRQGDIEYSSVYSTYLEHIIYYKIYNIIDWLYSEFLKIKKDSKLEVLVSRSNLLLSVGDPEECETISNIICQDNKKKEKKKKLVYHIKSKKIKSIRNKYDYLLEESIIDKFSRCKLLLAQ